MKQMVHIRPGASVIFVAALVGVTIAAAGLLLADSWANGAVIHGYLLWNLILAWVPFVLALRLRKLLLRKLWSSWEALLTTIAWLVFLPNAFYMISDFIHLPETGTSRLLFNTVLFTSFVYVSLILGISSLYLIHREMRRRLAGRATAGLVAGILLLCSFAVYIGRDLRWNSWDLLTNPTGLLFDVSERTVHPSQYPHILAFVLPFFVLLVSMYALAWTGVRFLRSHEPI